MKSESEISVETTDNEKNTAFVSSTKAYAVDPTLADPAFALNAPCGRIIAGTGSISNQTVSSLSKQSGAL